MLNKNAGHTKLAGWKECRFELRRGTAFLLLLLMVVSPLTQTEVASAATSTAASTATRAASSTTVANATAAASSTTTSTATQVGGMVETTSTNYTTSYSAFNNCSLQIEGSQLIINSVSEELNNKYLWFKIASVISQNTVVEDTVVANTLPEQISLAGLEDGEYYLWLYDGTDRYGTYQGYWFGDTAPIIRIRQGQGVFLYPKAYNQQLQFQATELDTDYALNYYRDPLKWTKDPEDYYDWVNYKDPSIVKAAKEITVNAVTDIAKIRAIHDWVAANIYYDYDGLADNSKLTVIASEVLACKRSVCQGYANLTVALLRAVGVPAKVVTGYADTKLIETTIKNNVSNHAWCEAYSEGRWMILDPTWDSGNAYKNGQYQKGTGKHLYYDVTCQVFSISHITKGCGNAGLISAVFDDLTGYEAYKETKVNLQANSKISLYPKGIKSLQLPSDATFTYELSGTQNAATVSDTGVVTFNATGYVIVTPILTLYGEKITLPEQRFWIVNQKSYIKITKYPTKLKVGSTYTCKATKSNVKGTFTWTSTNTKVASINKSTGKITAKKKGITTIVVKCGSYQASFRLKVN